AHIPAARLMTSSWPSGAMSGVARSMCSPYLRVCATSRSVLSQQGVPRPDGPNPCASCMTGRRARLTTETRARLSGGRVRLGSSIHGNDGQFADGSLGDRPVLGVGPVARVDLQLRAWRGGGFWAVYGDARLRVNKRPARLE